MNPGAYPEARLDINLSSDDEIVHPPESDAPADQKVQAGDDVGGVGASLAKLNPNSIRSGMLKKSKPFITDRALVVPPSGKCG
jgi:hypothetical protein